MAGWVVRASGDIEDPGVIRGLLDKLQTVLGKPEYGTGSSEFASAHAVASNFHAPDDTDASAGEATGSPGEEEPKTAHTTGAGRKGK